MPTDYSNPLPSTYPLADVLLKYTDTLKESPRFVGMRSAGDDTEDPLNKIDGPAVPGLISL